MSSEARARARKSAQAVQPAVGSPEVGWHLLARRGQPRPEGDRNIVATLVVGLVHTISYADGRLMMSRGKPVRICDTEFERLRDEYVPATYFVPDDETGRSVAWVKRRRKFKFQTLDGKEIRLPDLDDVRGDEIPRSDPTATPDARDAWQT